MKPFLSVAIVCTGAYNKFLLPLLEQIQFCLLPHKRKRVIVFTDQDKNDYEKNGTEFVFKKVKDRGWPHMTLDRYDFMLSCPELWEAEYVFYLDADSRFKAVLGMEIIGNLVAVEHYGYWGARDKDMPFERRKESTAAMKAYGSGSEERYYAGAFQGGKSAVYKEACEVLLEMIDTDKKNGITAVWQDESHWNAYLSTKRDSVHVLNPYYYCYDFVKVARRKDYWHGVFKGPMIMTVPKSDAEMGKHIKKV